MLKVLDEVASVEANCPESETFCSVVKDIRALSHKANQTLDTIIKADSSWFSNIFFRMVR